MRSGLIFALLSIIFCMSMDAQFLERWHQKSVQKRLNKIEKSLEGAPIELGANLVVNDGQIFLVTNDVKWFRKTMRPWKSGFRIKIISLANDPCSYSADTTEILTETVIDNVFYRAVRKKKSSWEVDNAGSYYLADIPNKLKVNKSNLRLMFTVDGKGKTYRAYVHPWGYTPLFDTIYNVNKNERMTEFLSSFRHKPSVKLDTLLFDIPFQASSDTVKWRKITSEVIYQIGTATSIDSVLIESFASVDGEEESNLNLAKQRGRNIKTFLSEFRLDTAKVQFRWGENWSLFTRQYQNGGIRFFDGLSHAEVKAFFRDSMQRKHWQKELEEQRTAQVELYCSTLHPIMLTDNEELFPMYQQALASKHYEEAEMVLYEMWTRSLAGNYTMPLLDTLHFSSSKKAKDFRNKHTWLTHLNTRQTKDCSLFELASLLEIQPRNPDLNYWYQYKLLEKGLPYSDQASQKQFEQKVKSMRRYKVPAVYSNQLLLNFYMGAAQLAQRTGQYKVKAYYMKRIYNLGRRKFKALDEVTDIAAFCSHLYYGDFGRKLLHPYIYKGKYNPKMLEAFVWMTLYKSDYFSDRNYQMLVQIMAENNPSEFLRMFQTSQEGGVAFYLLNHPFYRSLYCKCANSERSLITEYYGD